MNQDCLTNPSMRSLLCLLSCVCISAASGAPDSTNAPADAIHGVETLPVYTVKEFRSHYPEYDDFNDAELIKALEEHYSVFVDGSILIPGRFIVRRPAGKVINAPEQSGQQLQSTNGISLNPPASRVDVEVLGIGTVSFPASLTQREMEAILNGGVPSLERLRRNHFTPFGGGNAVGHLNPVNTSPANETQLDEWVVGALVAAAAVWFTVWIGKMVLRQAKRNPLKFKKRVARTIVSGVASGIITGVLIVVGAFTSSYSSGSTGRGGYSSSSGTRFDDEAAIGAFFVLWATLTFGWPVWQWSVRTLREKSPDQH